MIRPNDLDSQLREHFRATADSRTPPGVLEAVVARTATIQPRVRWHVRALDVLGLPRYRLGGQAGQLWLAAALLILAVLALAVVGGSGGGGSPFQGRWSGIDSGVDRSVEHLVVGAGSAPEVTFVDDFATMCQVNGDSDTSWHGVGTGTRTGDRLHVLYAIAGCTTWTVAGETIVYDYDPSSDTLVDSMGVTWRRAP